MKQPPHYDRCIAPLIYKGPVQKLHVDFKFHRNLVAGKALSFLLNSYLADRTGTLPELIIPVPLHQQRMRQRGFDQSLEIAKYLGRHLRIPVVNNLLHRRINTAPQSQLKRKERRGNLKNAFQLTAPVKSRHVVLIDDIMTTGCTFEAASRELKQAGVEVVEVWAVSRAIKP